MLARYNGGGALAEQTAADVPGRRWSLPVRVVDSPVDSSASSVNVLEDDDDDESTDVMVDVLPAMLRSSTSASDIVHRW